MAEPRVARMRVRNKQTGETAMVHGAQIVSGIQRALPRRGTADLLKAYSASPVLQAVVRKIATSMAAVEWQARVRTPDGDSIPAPGHLAEKLINGGVPGLDGVQCRMLEQTFIELVGESFAMMDRNRLGAPERRWPVPPHWIRNVPGPLDEWFEVNAIGGTPFHVARHDMIWHKDADPHDPYKRGVGIARSLADELNADEAAAKHTGSFLTNRARPDIIISGSKEVPLQREDALRLNEVWSQRFGGPDNAGKPFVSAAPITVETLTPTFRELELSKLREFERDIIISVFGVPPEIMGIIENSNRATIESAEFLFTKHVLKPRLEARRATYNEQLAWQYDDRLIIEFTDPVEENREFKLQVFTSRPQAFSDDEVRSLADEPPLPDGEGDARPQRAQPVMPPLVAEERSYRAKTLGRDEIERILDAIDRDLMANIVRANTRAAVAETGADALSDIGVSIDFDLDNPRVVQFIERTAADRSALIDGTTRDRLRTSLAEGVGSGETQRDLIRRVQAVVDDATAARADMIARTETTRAAGYANEEALQQANLTEKEWLAVQDDRTRDSHVQMDGQRQPVGEDFVAPSGALAPYPGGFSEVEESANCRCVVVAVDSLPDKAARAERWFAKASQMERLEATYARQLRSAFREQGAQMEAALQRVSAEAVI